MSSSLKEEALTTSDDSVAATSFNNLNEFYSCLKSVSSENLTETNNDLKIDFCVYIETFLEASVQCKEKPAKNLNYDLAVKIIEYVLDNETVLLRDSKLSQFISTKLNQVYFDKLVKVFLINPLNTLKTVKFLIKSLRKVMHQNLSIVNPLLQVMESGFKHGNNDVKSITYECWTSLILNFALDREFFFKPKKFNLIITPLINKCKAYKDESVSKAKALSWLCLIETINERMPTCIDRVLLPFFEFCFGYNDKKQQDKFEHSYESLFQIGFEVFFSIIFNGNLENKLDTNLKSKFKYVNPQRYYKIRQSLSDKESWQTILKYYFQVLTKKTFLNDILMIELWKKMCELFRIINLVENENENWAEVKKEFITEFLTEIECFYEYDLNDLKNSFLQNTFEIINNSQSTKNETNKFSTEISKNLCNLLSSKEIAEYILSNQKLSKELIIVFKRCISLMLLIDEENENTFLDNMNSLLIVLELQPNLNNWVFIASKYHDHLKALKSKTTVVNINQKRNDTIYKCLIYPFIMFDSLEIVDADLKLIINSVSNVVKSFTALVKLNRFKLSEQVNNEEDALNLNDWCSKGFNYMKQNLNLNKQQSNDSIIKHLQIYTQFILYFLQNVIEFETINQQQSLIAESGTYSEQVTHSLEIIERLNSSTKKFEKLEHFYSFFTGLIEIIKDLVEKFYSFILNSSNNNNNGDSLASNKKDSEISSDCLNSEKNKQPLQIFCSLIELMSILFTRVKSYQISNKFLVDFATCIEMISELNAISKASTHNQTNNSNNGEASPGNSLKRNSIRLSLSQSQQHLNFQSNRHSNDLYDKFSMQIASFIQNHLNKSYSNHQFDTFLLHRLEPIFYSFLKNSKLSLKQKTIQAWNTTFGKSTADALQYTSRLEILFSDLKDEMSKGSSTNSSNTSMQWISLPYFQSIQSTNLTNSFINEIDDFCLINEEKENKPKVLTPHHNHQFMQPPGSPKEFETKQQKTDSLLKTNLIKEFINESSSSSVPVAMLFKNNNKTPDRSSFSTSEVNNKSESEKLSNSKQNKKVQVQPAVNSIVTNFVFSPAGQNSFQIASSNITASCPPGFTASSSASKLPSSVMRTPDASNVISRSSPRSLKHNSKRKLDLNLLIDQMPDQDFVEITSNNNNCKMEESNDEIKMKINSKTMDVNKKRRNSLRQQQQPLTEHQKEMRRKRSFIPIEMQSISSVLEPTMDSQMSCTTTQDGFENSVSMSQMVNQQQTSKSIIDFSFSSKKIPAQIVTTTTITTSNEKMNESNNQMDISMPDQDEIITESTTKKDDDSAEANKNQSIKFQSKLNPKKQFFLFEVKQMQNSHVPEPKLDNLKVDNEEEDQIKPSQNIASISQSQETNEIISSQQSANDPDSCLTPSRRRSARLKCKDSITPSKLEFNDDTTSKTTSLTDEVEHLASQILTHPKLNQDELLEKLNEECKNEKIETKKMKLNKLKLKTKPKNIMKINHKIAVGKIAKKTFKEKQDEIKKKIKYKKLIKKLKSNKKIDKKEPANESVQTHVLVENEEKVIVIVEETKPNICTTPKIEEESEDEIPLKDLIIKNNKLKKEIKSVVNQTTTPAEAALISTPTSKSSTLTNTTAITTSSNCPVFKEIAAVSSESTAVLIQKLNNTPTTSILKKRELQKQSKIGKTVNLSASFVNVTSSSSNQDQESNLTPNKRRVSFCESVQIEEIEPNANKSIFRTTPKMPNRAKLVLFNNINNNILNRQVSSTLAVSASSSSSLATANSLLNSSGSQTISASTTTTPTPTTTTTTTPSATSTNNSNNTVTNTESKLNTSFNSSCLSPTMQNSKFPTSIGCALSSIANQLKINSSRLSGCEPILNSSSIVNTSSMNSSISSSVLNASQMSPSASSLIGSIFSNKSHASFLSQRSTKIQEQMLQLNSNNKSDLIIINATSPSKQKLSPIKSQNLNESEPILKQINLDIAYPTLKNCRTLIEKIAANSIFQAWLEFDAVKTFKLKNIITVNDLLNTNNCDDLPFKVPRQENLTAFMNKLEELSEKKRNKLLRKSNLNNNNNNNMMMMGSVEEEMNKLEQSNCLDTSIECENYKDDCLSQKAEEIVPVENELNPSSQCVKEIEQINEEDKSELLVNSKNDDYEMEVDTDKTNKAEESKSEIIVENYFEESLKIYKDYIMGNSETFNLPNLSSDQCKRVIEQIEEIEHTISSRSFQAKRSIRMLEKQILTETTKK